MAPSTHAVSDDSDARRYRPFLDTRGPDAPGVPVSDVNRFLCLPVQALLHGFVHTRGRHAGRPRWEPAVLSAMAWLWKKSKGHAETFTYHDGGVAEIGASEFVASVYGIAALIWTRFQFQPVPQESLYRPDFKAFYEVIRNAVWRLCWTTVNGAPLLRHLGPAREDIDGKASDAYGQRWSMEGSVVDMHLEECFLAETKKAVFANDAAALYRTILEEGQVDDLGGERDSRCNANLCDEYYVHQLSSDQGLVDVARVYDNLAAHDLNVFGTFRESAGKTGQLNRAERRVKALAWQRSQAQSQRSGSAHITVGAWEVGQATAADRRERPCTVPFLVADIDGPTPDRALPAVKALVGRLVALGVRPDDLVVAYTGGRGFHVRIPHGLVGRPVWPRAADVSRVVGRFFERVCDGLSTPEGSLYRSLDPALFSPLHLVRAIGSEHDRAPGRRCVAYRGNTFLELIGTLGDDGFLDVAEAQCQAAQPVPFLVPNPDRPQPVPALQEVLRAAICDVRKLEKSERARGEVQESRGIIDRIRQGVRPGEEFAPGYVGRNYAALLYSLYLVSNTGLSERAAWAELERWNADANPVPLGEAEGDADGELERVFDRACRFVSGRHQGDIPRAS